MSDLRSEMQRLAERVTLPGDGFERLERRRGRKDRNGRIGAAAVALLLVSAASLAAFEASRSAGERRPVSPELGPGFAALWPERSYHEAWVVQGVVNLGNPTAQYRLDASQTALRFAKDVLGWPHATVSGTVPGDAVSTWLTVQRDIPCLDGLTPWSGCPPTERLQLRRLVTADGIWSVTQVRGQLAIEGIAPGDAIANGQLVHVKARGLSDGTMVIAGVGATSSSCTCGTGSDAALGGCSYASSQHVAVEHGRLSFTFSALPACTSGYLVVVLGANRSVQGPDLFDPAPGRLLGPGVPAPRIAALGAVPVRFSEGGRPTAPPSNTG